MPAVLAGLVVSTCAAIGVTDAYQAGGNVARTNSTTGIQTGYSGLTTTLTVTSGRAEAEVASTMNSNRDWSVVSSTYTPSAVMSQRGLQWVANGTNCTYPNAGQTVTNCDKGSVTFTFSRPVQDPVFHIHDFGGRMEAGCTLAIQGTLTKTASAPSATTMAKLSGGITVSGNAITGRSSTPPTSESNHASGSVQITGTVSSITFSFRVALYRTSGTCAYDQNTMQISAVERLNATFSYQEDFGDGPASYEAPAAASHVIGDLRLGGSSITAEAATTLNSSTSVITVSPVAGASASGDTDDALGSPPSTAFIGQDYSLTVPISGASQSGQVCGFIDLNDDGQYTTSSPDERACTSFAPGATSVVLTWSASQWPVAAVAATDTGLRLRAAYGTGASSPTGPADSGEVEDYLISFVSPVPPVAEPVTSTATQDEDQTVTPTVSAGILVPSLTCIIDGASCVTTLTVAGEGTYTVNGDGTITFDPLPAFTGVATSITYRVEDSQTQQSTSTVTVTVVPAPESVDDSVTTAFNNSVTVEVLANDSAAAGATLDATSVLLCDTGESVPGCTASSITIPGEGTFTRSPTTGEIVFTPVATFVGTSSVPYQVSDNLGGTTGSTLSVTVAAPPPPTARPTTSIGTADADQTITLDASAGVGTALDPILTCIGDGVTCLRTYTVPGEGVYTVNADGTVTFDPDPSFAGPGTELVYRVEDETGQTMTSTLRASVVGTPRVTDDLTATDLDTDVTVDVLDNDTTFPGATLDPSSVRICTTATVAASCSLTSLVVPGEGTHTVNADGTVTFDPLPTFFGDATHVRYVVADSFGQVSAGLIDLVVNEPAASAAVADVSAGVGGAVQSVDPLANDIVAPGVTLDATTVRVCSPAATPPCTQTTLTVSGEGTYSVDSSTGVVSFTPVSGFTGAATPLVYSATDHLGRQITSTITPTVVGAPSAVGDSSAGDHDTNQIVDVLVNDLVDPAIDLDPTTVRLCVAGTVAASCVDTSLTIPGEGVYTANADGTVTFDPVPEFSGAATSIAYVVADDLAQVTMSSLSVSVAPPDGPIADDERQLAIAGTTVEFTAIVGPRGLSEGVGITTGPGSGGPCLIDPASGTCGTTVVIAGEGSWSIDQTSGVVSFTAEPGVATGVLTPVQYRVTDIVGQTTTGELSIVVPAAPQARPDDATTPAGAAVTIDVLGNDTPGESTELVDSTLRLCSLRPVQEPPHCDATSIAIAGQGTYRVTSGAVVFEPEPSFAGDADGIRYQVLDDLGRVADSTVEVTVERASVAGSGETDDVVVAESQERHVQPGQSIVFRPITGIDGLVTSAGPMVDAGSACIVDPATGSCGRHSVTVPGVGTFTFDPALGAVSFTARDDAVDGATASVEYRVIDEHGNEVGASLSVVVTLAPVPTDDMSLGVRGQPQWLSVLGNDAVGVDGHPLLSDTLRLCASASFGTACEQTRVVIPGEGVFEVLPDGLVVFTPDPDFVGTASPIVYEVTDRGGTVLSGSIRVVVGDSGPSAAPDRPSGPGPVIMFDPLVNDLADLVALDPASVRLCGVGESVPHCSALEVVTVDGVYTLDPVTGWITFRAAPGFSGQVTHPIVYQVSTVESGGRSAIASSVVMPMITPTLPSTGTGGLTPPAVAILISAIGAVMTLFVNARRAGRPTR